MPRYMVYMDENGDAEGNYTLIARKLLPQLTDEYGLFPVGIFTLRSNNSKLPVSFFFFFLRERNLRRVENYDKMTL